MGNPSGAPLEGMRVVEAGLGTTVVGCGLATSLPGMILRDLGAEVVCVRTAAPSTLDAGIGTQAWDHGKQIVVVAPSAAADTVRRLAATADVVLIAGGEGQVEGAGLGYQDLTPVNERLVHSRIRPSTTVGGPIGDFELLVQARAGLLSQLRGNRPGPLFAALDVGAAGAGLAAALGALANLFQRENSGRGGWSETSLYEGLFSLLPMVVGRVEHPSPATAALWDDLGPAVAWSFRCADGEYIQFFLAPKHAYEDFLALVGDRPSPGGFTGDILSGEMGRRKARWAEVIRSRDRAAWLEDLLGKTFITEPVLRPGEILLDHDAIENGISVIAADPELGPIRVPGRLVDVVPRDVDTTASAGAGHGAGAGAALLTGVRVVDLSAYLAGPVAPQLLADLGADVVKVEPVTGDVHRPIEPMFAAGQRGKRALALDMKAPEAAEVMRRLFKWGDVVFHNSRLGLAERLGYDETTVRSANPRVLYCHATGNGERGRRAHVGTADHLIQALTGIEAGAGGDGQPPTFVPWGLSDVVGGWVSACAVVAGLVARRVGGRPQRVSTSLLAAGAALRSGPIVVDGAVREGPVLDGHQMGYGATYRIYRASDDRSLALVVPDQPAWSRLRDVVARPDLPTEPPPLRTQRGLPADPAEEILEAAFASRPVAEWLQLLGDAGVPAELVVERDRAGFIGRMFDDPVNRERERIVTYRWGARGVTEQAALPIRFGPEPPPTGPRMLPELGEHSTPVLLELGFSPEQVDALLVAGVIATPRGAPARGSA